MKFISYSAKRLAFSSKIMFFSRVPVPDTLLINQGTKWQGVSKMIGFVVEFFTKCHFLVKYKYKKQCLSLVFLSFCLPLQPKK